MRAFLGVKIPEELKAKIASVQRKFSDFDVKLVEPENLHFNLKFFAEIGDDDVARMKKILEDACKQSRPFSLGIAGLGVFPNKSYIRVVWIGVREGHDEICSLAKSVKDSIKALDIEDDEKFVPHLTLGRVRSARDKNEIARVIEEMNAVEIGIMRVDKIILFQSKLTPNGPKYEENFSVNLLEA